MIFCGEQDNCCTELYIPEYHSTSSHSLCVALKVYRAVGECENMMSTVRRWFGRGLDQDWVDSANGFWSVLLLAVLSAGAFVARYVTDPISCWVPAQFTRSHYNYAEYNCFLHGHVNAPITTLSPQRPTAHYYDYHLWIPLILFFQALCFKIPNIIWNTGKHYLTLNLDETVDTLKEAQVKNAASRKSVFLEAVRLVDALLERNKFFLAVLYLFVKLLFCLNLVGQLIFLTVYFRNSLVLKAGTYVNFDIEPFIKPLLTKIVMCDFNITQNKRFHSYTVQCVLPITEIYEKLFVFLWYWIFLLAVVTIFNLLLWAGFLFLPFLRDSRITAYIKACPGSSQDSSVITRFISGFLGIDGVLVLSMISRNSSEMVAANLSQQLYQVFLEKGSPHPSAQSTSAGRTAHAPPEIVDGTQETVNPEKHPEKPPIV